MSNDRSREALIKFLDFVADKGLTPVETAKARKVAVGKVFGILTPEETSDIFKVDVPQTMLRFNNLHGQKYTPGSLTTYQSRINKALDDFGLYLKNPLSFRPTGQTREKVNKSPHSNTSENSKASPAAPREAAEHIRAAPISDTILPIAIRADLTVYIQGLPFNLSKAEASKIAAVVMALSGD